MKPIKNFDGYFVNENGEVFSNRQRIPNQRQGLIKLKPTINCDGYLVVTLRNSNKTYQGKVHRLVLETFNPVENADKLIVRHLDDVKTNNHLGNLAWGTPQDNINDMIRNGNAPVGIKNPAAKLTAEQVRQIKGLVLFSTMSYQKIAKIFNISKGHIANIMASRVWRNIHV